MSSPSASAPPAKRPHLPPTPASGEMRDSQIPKTPSNDPEPEASAVSSPPTPATKRANSASTTSPNAKRPRKKSKSQISTPPSNDPEPEASAVSLPSPADEHVYVLYRNLATGDIQFKLCPPVPEKGDDKGARKFWALMHMHNYRMEICKAPKDSILISTERLRAYAKVIDLLELLDMFIDTSQEFQCLGVPCEILKPHLGFEDMRVQIELEETRKLTGIIRSHIQQMKQEGE